MFGELQGRQAWDVGEGGMGVLGKRLTLEATGSLKCGEQGGQVPEASALASPQPLPLHRTVLRPPWAGPGPSTAQLWAAQLLKAPAGW